MRKLLLAGVHSILFAMLAFLYVDVVSPLYDYYGFFTMLNKEKLVTGGCVAVAVGMLISARIKRVSDFMMWILYLLVLLPSMVIYGCQDRSDTYALMLAACFVLVDLVRRFRVALLRLPNRMDGTVVGLSVVIVMAAICVLLASGALSYFNLDFDKVYEHRTDINQEVFGVQRGDVHDVSTISYLCIVAFDVCNIFLISKFLHERRFHLAGLCIALQIFYFGLSSEKSYAYSIFFPLYFFMLGDRARAYMPFVISVTLTVVLAFLEFAALDSYFLAGSFIGRMFYLPAILNFSYHDIFAQLGYVYLSNSRFNPFADFQYSLDPGFLVGWIVFRDANANANNGFLATSYMHFGYIGMVLYSVIVGFMLSIVDSLTRRKDNLWVRLSFVLLPFFRLLTSVDLTTSLLSHGVLASLLMSWLYSGLPSRRALEARSAPSAPCANSVSAPP